MSRFIGKMNVALAERYSGRPLFSEGQVRTTMATLGYSETYAEVALLLFCDEEVYKELGLDRELVRRHEGYRRSILSGGGSEYGAGSGAGGDGGGCD